MKKRVLLCLLAFSVMLLCLSVTVACEGEGECSHTWADATCTEPQTCTICKLTQGQALGHTGGMATCQTKATCTRCGQTYGQLGEHSWEAASCSSPRTCSECHTSDGVALGHTGGTATCTAKAVCSRCNEPYGNFGEHTWAEATCTAPKTCTVCNTTQGQSLGHTGGTATATQKAVCTRCGEEYGNFATISNNISVYYTNSNRWSSVYAYVWNYSSNKEKNSWPGEKLSVSGTSGFGEDQYCVSIDTTKYDRIIFNDGKGNQTKDLVVSRAVSGYYGEDGVFTMNTDNYGKVQYFTLTDAKNLNYISGNSKKISVYTPANYNPSKKYGVLYMFDGQNLYAAASGAQTASNAWAVDVAVTSLVQNGGEGVIIVAIDNTDGHRDAELTMSQSFGTLTNLADEPAFYNGKLDELGNFMKETLIPWVNSHYSVDTSREKTGIAGSSSGGLAAYYLGLRDNDIYGYIGAFSPANGLFTSADWLRFYAGKNFSAGRPKIYAYCGVNDYDLEDKLAPATKEIKKLTSYGFAASGITENYVNGATHNETYWRIAFAEFLALMVG